MGCVRIPPSSGAQLKEIRRQAGQVLSRVQAFFQVELSMHRFFEAPTVDLLAQALLDSSDQPAKVEQAAERWLRVLQLPEEERQTLMQQRLAAGFRIPTGTGRPLPEP